MSELSSVSIRRGASRPSVTAVASASPATAFSEALTAMGSSWRAGQGSG